MHPRELERIIGKSGCELLESAGLVSRNGGRIRPLLRIYLFEGLVFFHDAPSSGLAYRERAYMARDSLRFADYLKREISGRRFKRSLDLGTGCGIQASVLAACSDEVIGVDYNPRALALARLNARINGVGNVAFQQADFSDHPKGVFDLVVSNPPFLYLPRPLPEGFDPASDGGCLGIGSPRRILSRLDALLGEHGEGRVLTSLPRSPKRQILEDWMRRNLISRGFDVRLRFVEYLWRDDQADAYQARGLGTPALVVAEVRRGERPRLRKTPPPLAERLILARRLAGRRWSRSRRRAMTFRRAARPERLGRIAPLALACAMRATRVPARPLRLAVEPSTRCPIDCVSCARAERIGDGRFMEVEAFGRILSEIRPRLVHFHGSGEPLTNPGIDELCRMSREAGTRTALLTSLPDVAMVPLATRSIRHLDRLIIGVDAARPETHAAIRRGSDFCSVVEGIRHLLRIRSQESLGTSVVLSFLIQDRNYEEIPAFIRFAYRLGADAAIFLSLDLYGIESRGPSLLESLQLDKLLRLLNRARIVASRMGLPTNIDLLLGSTMVLRHRYGRVPLPGSARCLRPWLSTYVTVDGCIRPCSRYAYDREATLGRVEEGSGFMETWNGPAYGRLRRELRQGCPSLLACKECPVPFEEGGLLGNLWRRRKSP
jgi:MoaA/NifB/PqqE/SkfB family radical SAM enzyme